MREWRRRPEERLFGWFVSGALLTAVAVVFCGGGFGGSPPAVGQIEPLRLTLSAPQICETGHVGEALGSHITEGGSRQIRRYGWRIVTNPVGEIDVGWTVRGGVAPYTLTIDGETQDRQGAFTRRTGTGSVSCVLSHTGAVWDGYPGSRYFREKPVVDSGLKMIRATVTDATGATAEASIDVYVILAIPWGTFEETGRSLPMHSGKTYRMRGLLVTIPTGITIEAGGEFDSFGGPAGFTLDAVDEPGGQHLGVLVLHEPYPYGRFEELWRTLEPIGSSDNGHDLNAKFDELLASVGQLPLAVRGAP